MLAEHDEYTPTPAVSHAILCYNRGRRTGLADGIVVTPSHNPPDNGGFKYNPPNGGPADTNVTGWIQDRANELMEAGLGGVKRIPYQRALRAATTHRHDYLGAYVRDLGNVIDMDAIRGAGIHVGVDPLGGAGVHYWAPIAERYKLDLTVVSEDVDQTFRFMTVDWDGQIRMDPSSPYAMGRLIALKDRFDIAVACDTDHDRHGIVTRSAGLLPPNHYLSARRRVGRGARHQRQPRRGGRHHPADRILAVDGRAIEEMPTDQAANLLQGREGTRVTLSVAAPGQASRTLSIRRRRVEVPSVDKVQMLDTRQGVGYLRLTCFQKTTRRDLEAALWQLHREGMRSLVVDFRGNPGGLLITAVEVVELFVDHGVIVSTHGHTPRRTSPTPRTGRRCGRRPWWC